MVVAFSPSDPFPGTGVQSDLLTLASMGCPPATVVTALTAQGIRATIFWGREHEDDNN